MPPRISTHELVRRSLACATLVALGIVVALIGGAVASTDALLIGSQDVTGRKDSLNPGVAEAFRTTASSSGQVTSLHVYVTSWSRATSLTAGIYADASGHPGQLLAQGTGATNGGDWSNVQLGSSAAVTAGTTYWIAVLGPTGSRLAVKDGANGGASETSVETSLTSLPGSWSTGKSSSYGPLSAYGVGIPAASTSVSDTAAPSAPTNLAVSAASQTSVTLSWSASIDNVGVTGYDVLVDGSAVGQTSSTSLGVSGLTCGTTHTFAVDSYDSAGNHSSKTSLNGSTSPCTTDTQAPTTPTGLKTTGATTSSVSLAWTASTDNVGVTGYDVYRGTTLLGVATGTSYAASGLTCGTSYSFAVDARDAAGNRSAKASVNGSTSACPNTPNSVRVNAGGGSYSDSSGNTWSSDCCNSGGNTFSTTASIAGTSDPSLYQNERWNSGSFSYTLSNLAAGTYQVTLKFAEIAGLGPGQRQFNVAINGSQVLTNLDVAAQVGLNKALDKVFTASADSNGQLAVTFSRGAVENPIVSAVQVVPALTSSSTSTSTPPPSSTADPSGQPMPVGDISGWNQIYADNFANESLPLGTTCGDSNGFPHPLSNWTAYPYPWKGTPTWGTYCPERTTSIHDGQMDIWLHSESVGGSMLHLIDAPIPKIASYPNSNSQLYGRYVVRFYQPSSFPMFHLSWLLWPDSNVWPGDGEIDYPEGDTNGTMWAFMHWMNATSGGQQYAYSTGVPVYGAWHTAVIEWLPSRVTFLLDGNIVGSTTDTSKIPSKAMHFIIQNGGSFGVSSPDSTSQGHILIDWVTIYARATGAS